MWEVYVFITTCTFSCIKSKPHHDFFIFVYGCQQDDQSPKGGDHQPQIFDGNIDLSFLENEEGNVTGGISDSSVAEAPNSQLLDFDPSSFGTPLMEVSKSAFPTMVLLHLSPNHRSYQFASLFKINLQ